MIVTAIHARDERCRQAHRRIAKSTTAPSNVFVSCPLRQSSWPYTGIYGYVNYKSHEDKAFTHCSVGHNPCRYR
jgi:hypothetical protein